MKEGKMKAVVLGGFFLLLMAGMRGCIENENNPETKYPTKTGKN